MNTQAQNIGLGSWPERRARLTPQDIAWTFEGKDTTFAQVEERVNSLAAALAARGVEAGTRVAYMGTNHPALLETLFAAGRLGAITVLINTRLSRHEVHYILQDSGASILVHGAEQLAQFQSIEPSDLPGLQRLVNVDADVTSVADSAASSGWLLEDYRELLQQPPEVNEPAPVSLDDPCLIMYTSGTTGRPKGAVLSHGNIFFNDMNVLIETDLRPDEVCLAAAPLFHIAGLNGLVLPVFLKGGRLVIVRQFRAEAALEIMARERTTCMFGVPAMLDALSQHPQFTSTDLGAMRTLIVGGAPVPARILRLFSDRGIKIQQGYGLTETAPAVLKLGAEDAVAKIGSAGKPQFLVDVRIVDPTGDEVGVGGTGEILTRGPNVFTGYWGREQDTAAAFTDDWFHTGDVATIDDAGFVFLRDRSKDMYISGGENVYPSEIENALLDVPGVVEAAVIGIPDERWGEVGSAYIIQDPTADLSQESVLAGLAGRLARYKQPRHIHIVEQLPRTSTGKLQKHVLREREETP